LFHCPVEWDLSCFGGGGGGGSRLTAQIQRRDPDTRGHTKAERIKMERWICGVTFGEQISRKSRVLMIGTTTTMRCGAGSVGSRESLRLGRLRQIAPSWAVEMGYMEE